MLLPFLARGAVDIIKGVLLQIGCIKIFGFEIGEEVLFSSPRGREISLLSASWCTPMPPSLGS